MLEPESVPSLESPEPATEDGRDIATRRPDIATSGPVPTIIEVERPTVDVPLRTIDVFYGTNRNRASDCLSATSARWNETRCTPASFYAGTTAEALEVGAVTVSFPPDHEVGNVERPFSILSITFRDEDPLRDVVITEIDAMGSDFDRWAASVNAATSDTVNQAFIYVHGYATPFDDAARRTAQVALDLDMDVALGGIPMLFSWPSRGTTQGYVADLDSADDATDALNAFIDIVRSRTAVQRVHLIAHSMGNRVVTEALGERLSRGNQSRLFDELIMAAPDVPARRFQSRFLETLPQLAKRVTLYVADDDVALYVSRALRDKDPRAGQVAGGLLDVEVAGFNAINASSLTRDFLAHSYHANNDSMLSDIYCLLKGADANLRPLIEPVGPAWTFREDRPPSDRADVCASPITPVEQAPWYSALLYWAWLPFAVLALIWWLRGRRAAG